MSSFDAFVTRDDIFAAFRLLLERLPDPDGLQGFSALAEGGAYPVGAMVAHIMASEEFRARQARAAGVPEPVDIGGSVVFVNPREPEFGRHVAAHGGWEPHILACLAAHLRPGDTFVDVGANVGIMSFTAARIVGPGGRVIAFEPDAVNARQYLMGVQRNGLSGFVRLYPFALSDRPSLFALEGNSNAYLTRNEASDRLVQSLPGDDLLLHEGRVDFVKLDIEGHEPFALAGLRRTLARFKPLVLCEFNPRCLNAHLGRPPAEFAATLFGLTDALTAIEHDGASTVLQAPDELMALWSARDAEAVRTGLLPEGMVHFDLLFRADRAG